eukprot:1150108-Pelagomonas_calceolata.AAC.3
MKRAATSPNQPSYSKTVPSFVRGVASDRPSFCVTGVLGCGGALEASEAWGAWGHFPDLDVDEDWCSPHRLDSIVCANIICAPVVFCAPAGSRFSHQTVMWMRTGAIPITLTPSLVPPSFACVFFLCPCRFPVFIPDVDEDEDWGNPNGMAQFAGCPPGLCYNATTREK